MSCVSDHGCQVVKRASCWLRNMTVAVAMAMIVRGCHEYTKLASCWWHTMTVMVTMAIALVVKIFHEEVKLASSVLVVH